MLSGNLTSPGKNVCKIDPVLQEAETYKTAANLRRLCLSSKEGRETEAVMLEAKSYKINSPNAQEKQGRTFKMSNTDNNIRLIERPHPLVVYCVNHWFPITYLHDLHKTIVFSHYESWHILPISHKKQTPKSIAQLRKTSIIKKPI